MNKLNKLWENIPILGLIGGPYFIALAIGDSVKEYEKVFFGALLIAVGLAALYIEVKKIREKIESVSKVIENVSKSRGEI